MIQGLKCMGRKFRNMAKKAKRLRPDSKFLIITFFLCFIGVVISSMGVFANSDENMSIIRTIFSALLGYIVENVTRSNDKPSTIQTTTTGQEEEQSFANQEQVNKRENIKEDNNIEEPMLEMRVLIIGHMVMFIVVLLIIGAFLDLKQSNASLILLKNSVFTGIGFLISASHMKEKK